MTNSMMKKGCYKMKYTRIVSLILAFLMTFGTLAITAAAEPESAEENAITVSASAMSEDATENAEVSSEETVDEQAEDFAELFEASEQEVAEQEGTSEGMPGEYADEPIADTLDVFDAAALEYTDEDVVEGSDNESIADAVRVLAQGMWWITGMQTVNAAKEGGSFFKKIGDVVRDLFGYYDIKNASKLQKAAAEGGNKWKLKQDINNVSGKIDFKKATTIQGNGHKITSSIKEDLFTISAAVTLKNLTLETTNYSVKVNGDGTLTVSGGSYSGVYFEKGGRGIVTNDAKISKREGYFTVHFHANGGTGTMKDDPFYVKHGTNTPLPTNTFKYNGYVFAGWKARRDDDQTWYLYDKNGNRIWSNNTALSYVIYEDRCVVAATAPAGGSVTFFAVWKNDPYYTKMNAFINDNRWANGASWSAERGPVYPVWPSKGCCAYAVDFVYYVFGKKGQNSGKKFTSPSEIKEGDIIYLEDGYTSPHWVVILERSGNKLHTAESWSDQVRITWDHYEVNGSNKKLTMSGKVYYFQHGYHYR